MTDPKMLFVRLAVIKAVTEAAKEAEKQTKTLLEDVMDPGDRKSAVLDGNDVGTVSWTRKNPEAHVTDPQAFGRFVAQAAPTEATYPVTVDARELIAVLDPLVPGEDSEAQAIRLGRIMRAAREALNRPQVNPAYEKMLLDRAARDGALVDPETGEVLDCVTVSPPGPGYIAVRLTDTHRQNIANAIADGKVTLPEVVTPLALEGPR